jgi:hypothetical protein
MRLRLRRHPDSAIGPAVASVEVELSRPRADRLMLSYVLAGQLNEVRMPPPAMASRGDRLWQHTCFEAFVRSSSCRGYYEFNFSPSTQWAAYRFSGYRTEMSVATEIRAVPVEVSSSRESFTLQATLGLDDLPDMSREESWRLGLSAVIEDTSGHKSYWALAHPPGKPDFHDAVNFAHELSPAVRT